MVANPAVLHLIREGPIYEVPSVIQIGSKEGMQLLHHKLANLVLTNAVEPQWTLLKSSYP